MTSFGVRFGMLVRRYRDALKERTRERVSLDWAGTTFILGYTRALIGERQSDLKPVREGIAQIEDALPVLRDGAHGVWTQYAEARLEQARAIEAKLFDE